MDSGKKKFQATSNAGSLAILHSKFPELSVSLSGNESDDEEDDFIDDELTGEDFAPVFEGMLSLKDFEEGDWLDCSGILQREMFSLYTADHEGSTELELFDSADVRKIADVIYHEEQLTVVQYEHDGHPFILRGDNLQELHDKIQEAMRVFGEKGETKCGWLLKKPSYMEGHLDTSDWDHNLGKPRFARLTPKSLRYYIDDELDSTEVGSINLLAMDSVICEDEEDTSNCVFEVHSGQRVVVFEAASREEAEEWVQKLNAAHESALQESDELKEEKYNANTDDRILLFDHEGPEAFTLRIDADLSHTYPTQEMAIAMHEEAKAHAATEGEGGEDIPDPWWPVTLEDHIYCADGCVEYLADFVSRIQKNEFQEARYEVLARCVLRVNTYFSTRMLPFLSDPNSDELVAASANDIYNLILWITKYQKILRFIYCPVDSTLDGSSSPNKANTLTHCSIFEEVPALCQRYLDGNADNNIEGTASHLIGVCLTMWSNVLKAPADAIDKHKDGTFFTHTPSDVWRSLRQHITLATKAESPVLHVMVADKIAMTMIHLIDSITEWLTFNYHDTVEGVDKNANHGTLEDEKSENASKEEDTSPAGRRSSDPTSSIDADAARSLKDVQLEFLCALANDNALHIEEVYDITDNFASDDIRESIETAFDPVTTRIVACGNLCLKRLANVVLADVEQIMEEVMTESWLNHDGDDDNDDGGDDSGGQMASIIATLEDYLADILTYLNNFWSKKFIAVLFEAMTVRYTRAILFRKMKTGVASAFKNLTGSVPKGGVTPQRSLDGVHVHEHDHDNASAINLESEFDDEDDDEDESKGADKSNGNDDDMTEEEESSRMSVNIANLGRRMSIGMSNLKTGLTSMLSPTNTETSGSSSASNTKQDTADGKSFFGNIMSTKNTSTLTLDNEIIGRIAQDQSAMNSFFTKHGGQELASEVLLLVSEVITLCSLPAEQLTTHAVSLIADHPVAAISVREATLACMRLRDDLSSEDKEYALQKMELILMGAEAAARKNEIEGIDEGRLGLLYVELVENAISAGALAPHPDAKKTGNSLANSLAQRQKEKAGVNMNSMHNDSKRKLKSETVRKREALEEETEGLLTKVVEALAHQEEARKEYMEAEDRELARAQEMLKSHANIIHFKGFLERKPPSALAWTKNYFLLSTKKNEEALDHTDIEAMATYKVYKYNFCWSEHRNTQVRHSFDVENIYSIFLLEIPMECQLVFVEEDHVLMLREHLDDYLENLLQQGGYDMDNNWYEEEIGDDERVYPVRINNFAKNPDVKGLNGVASSPKSITVRESVTGRAPTTSGNKHYLTFCLSMIDGAKHMLRTSRLGKAVHWINSIADAGSFSYEHENKEWNRQARMMLKEKDKMRGVELLEQQQQLAARMEEHNRIKEQLARQQEAIEMRMQQEQQELQRQLEEESNKKNNPRERKKSMSADRARRDSVRNNAPSTVDGSSTNDAQGARYNMGKDLEGDSIKNPIIASSTIPIKRTTSSKRGTHNPIHMQTDVAKAVSLMNDLNNNANGGYSADTIPMKAALIEADRSDSSMMINTEDTDTHSRNRRDSDHIPSSGHTQTLPISSIANLPASTNDNGNVEMGLEEIRLSSLSERAKERGADTYQRRLTTPMSGNGLSSFEEWEQQQKQPGCADKCVQGGCIVT